jgi:hypothetical protein
VTFFSLRLKNLRLLKSAIFERNYLHFVLVGDSILFNFSNDVFFVPLCMSDQYFTLFAIFVMV